MKCLLRQTDLTEMTQEVTDMDQESVEHSLKKYCNNQPTPQTFFHILQPTLTTNLDI